jgi:hypothetical protein
MSNVWLLPPDTDSVPAATGEDLLVRLAGDDAQIARLVDGNAEWLGSVPAASLGPLPSSGGEPAKVEDERALIAVQGAASALVERGG